MKDKYLAYSDTHFNFTLPWTLYGFVERVIENKPNGLFLPGDIACGITIKRTLAYMAKKLDDVPIYFVAGNHDYYGTSLEVSNDIFKTLCKKYHNLKWLSNEEVIELKSDVALVGEDGWYDLRSGNPKLAVYNFDWCMIEEFRRLKSFDEKIALSQQLADQSAANLKRKLLKALRDYKTIIVITHMPPWADASCVYDIEPLDEYSFSYHTNTVMGEMIEEVMADHQSQNVIVICGHTHCPLMLNVAHNIECIVIEGKYLGLPKKSNSFFL